MGSSGNSQGTAPAPASSPANARAHPAHPSVSRRPRETCVGSGDPGLHLPSSTPDTSSALSMVSAGPCHLDRAPQHIGASSCSIKSCCPSLALLPLPRSLPSFAATPSKVDRLPPGASHRPPIATGSPLASSQEPPLTCTLPNATPTRPSSSRSFARRARSQPPETPSLAWLRSHLTASPSTSGLGSVTGGFSSEVPTPYRTPTGLAR